MTPRHVCVAAVALGDIHRRFTWQAWHLATSTFVSHGRRGTYDTWLALVTRLVLCDAALLYVAGAALGDIRRRFTWQAWHLVASESTFVLCGRRATYGTGLALVARLVPGTPRYFAWQAWHLVTSTFVLCGRRAT